MRHRRVTAVALCALLTLVVAVVAATAASRSFAGDVDNDANVWHTNNCNGGYCQVSSNGSVPLALDNNVRCGSTRTLYVRLLFSNGTVSGGSSYASCGSLPHTVTLATSVLAGSYFKIQGKVNEGIPTFGDTRFGGTVSNVR